MLSARILRVAKPATTRFSTGPLLTLRRLQSTIPTPSTTTAKGEAVEDYPDVPRELYYYRDPDGKWDDVQNRRNFGQELNPDDDILNMWSPHYYDTVSDSKAVALQLTFFGAVGAFSAMMYFFFYPERNAVPRDYPDGLAKDLGARSEEDAHLYRVRVDKTY